MYGLTSDDCILLVLYATIILGSFGGLRKIFATKSTLAAFSVILTVCETLVAFIAWASFDFPRDNMSWSDFLEILGGGAFAVVGEYLYFACCMHLYVSTATGASILVQATVGVYLTYLVDSENVETYYLLLGVVISVVGLACIIGAETMIPSPKEKLDSEVDSNGHFGAIDENQPLVSDRQNDLGHGNVDPAFNWSQTTYWVILACFSGLMMTGLGILSAVEETSDSGTQIPSQLNLIYQAGQLIGLPIAIFLFSYLEILGKIGYPVPHMTSVLNDCLKMPAADFYWSIAIGLLSGTGSLAYYFGILEVPYSVSYAITTCQVVIATICSAILFQEFSGLDCISVTAAVLVLGILIYGVALYVLMELAY